MKKWQPSELSRILSHALRHEPEAYGLQLGRDGWVPIGDVLSALRSFDPKWADVARDDVERLVASASKRRHEIRENRIRAIYGHSAQFDDARPADLPPSVLYHGTSSKAAEAILGSALKPMSRRHVHLSATQEAAYDVGKRKAHSPVVLTVRALEAHRSGIKFYHGEGFVWLSETIPAEFISR